MNNRQVIKRAMSILGKRKSAAKTKVARKFCKAGAAARWKGHQKAKKSPPKT